MTRIPPIARTGGDRSDHNLYRDLLMADQIVADQAAVGVTHGEETPEADPSRATDDSEIVFEDGCFFVVTDDKGRPLAYVGADFVEAMRKHPVLRRTLGLEEN